MPVTITYSTPKEGSKEGTITKRFTNKNLENMTEYIRERLPLFEEYLRVKTIAEKAKTKPIMLATSDINTDIDMERKNNETKTSNDTIEDMISSLTADELRPLVEVGDVGMK